MPAKLPYSKGLRPTAEKVKAPPIDEQLWAEIHAIMPRELPKQLPAKIGTVNLDGKEWPVYEVDGDWVKIHHDMDYVEAGNSVEDPHFPPPGPEKDFIVLDADHTLDDQPYCLYHECCEMRDMLKGMDYDKAHPRANAAEKILRQRDQRSQT